MNYLFDTHTLLWSLFSPKKLSGKVHSTITDPQNTMHVSALSLWEISLKYALGKIVLPSGIHPEDIVRKFQTAGGTITNLQPEVAASMHQLPREHGDPFDRMLVWQAIQSNYILISKDKEMKKYEQHGLSVLW
ncbi:MAG: type II toxin-antitoxin system VapC family toxin [bacterium]|nr:type II toxin-antitoxin system VapC family toxin [bacterium]